MEVWKSIPGFSGYEVSNKGKIRSFRKRGGGRRKVPNILVPYKEKGRYCHINLRRDGKTYGRKVHSLVLLAFVGPAPEGLECCHKDGDTHNNLLSNLRYDTHQVNTKEGAVCKLEDKEVRLLREDYCSNLDVSVIANRYNVSVGTVYNLGCGMERLDVGGPTHKRKLKDRDVISIRRRRSEGESLNSIANDVGRDKSTVSRICRGCTYSTVGGPIVGQ